MFDLEKAIADWREQMLAAGIKSPVPLEELEIHLREEIERWMGSGRNEQRAFEISASQIGRHDLLKMEFAKNDSFFYWLGHSKTTKANRILGVLWFAQCTWFLIRSATSPVAVAMILYFPHYWQFFTVFMTLLSSTGVIGSMLLFRGTKFGVSVIRIIAILEFLLCVVECVTQGGSFGPPNYWFGIFTVFSFITIWLLQPPKHKEPKCAVG